jgi:hypothetical protein
LLANSCTISRNAAHGNENPVQGVRACPADDAADEWVADIAGVAIATSAVNVIDEQLA